MRRIPALLLLSLTSLPWLASCGSTGGQAPDVSNGARVLFIDPRVGMTLGIVNDAHLRSLGIEGGDEYQRRASFYSTKRDETMTKVAGDDVVGGMIQALDSEGFARFGVAGGAAGGAGGSVLEITSGRDVRHFQFAQSMNPSAMKAYQACRAIFLDVYNVIPQYQAADPSQIRLEGASASR